MLKTLEYKKYIVFNRQTGKFDSGYLDIDRVEKAFPNLYKYVTWKQGSSSLDFPMRIAVGEGLRRAA
jgi:hypothetical protein